MSRQILIHGYVETPAIFDALAPLLPPATEQLRLDLSRDFAHWNPAGPVNARTAGQYLAQKYAIRPTDLVIGHSMGGWLGANIKQLTDCQLIQVASWTDQTKIVSPVRSLAGLGFMVRTGIMQSRFVLDYFQKVYPFSESAALHAGLVQSIPTLTKTYLLRQQHVLFAPVLPLTSQPNGRIHARRDNIVRPPDEPFTEVPGDHFSLIFHAPLVADAIRKTLAQPALAQ
jgi:pimeloyl-ACP methyl ester carboxylesterase